MPQSESIATAPDSSGRRKPVPVPGTEFDIDAELVLAGTASRL